MLISFLWVVVAFILGGTFGALGLAVFSAMPEVNLRDTKRFAGIGHTH